MPHEKKLPMPSPAELRSAFLDRQREIQGKPGVRALRTGDEVIYDDGMLDQCSIGYYPPEDTDG